MLFLQNIYCSELKKCQVVNELRLFYSVKGLQKVRILFSCNCCDMTIHKLTLIMSLMFLLTGNISFIFNGSCFRPSIGEWSPLRFMRYLMCNITSLIQMFLINFIQRFYQYDRSASWFLVWKVRDSLEY